MMAEEEIVRRLTHIGFKDHEIPDVMQDVGKLIAGKAMLAYLSALPEDKGAPISSIIASEPEELQSYLTEHAAELPPFSQAKFDAIHDDTWREYFKAVS
jgi:hypothetical protein